MKQPQPDNYIEILGYLKEHPEGLTTGKLFAIAEKKRYFKFKNTNTVSACVNAMRAKKLLTTSEAIGGKIHKITLYGRAQLDDEPDQPEPAAYVMPAVMPYPKRIEPIDEIILDIQDGKLDVVIDDPGQVVAEVDIIAKLDETFGAIRTFLIESMTHSPPPVKIKDKTVKITVLERLVPMYNEEISQVLNDIKADLEQIESQ